MSDLCLDNVTSLTFRTYIKECPVLRKCDVSDLGRILMSDLCLYDVTSMTFRTDINE
jgi:hypothetical protein